MRLDPSAARVAFRDRPLADVLDLAVRFVVVHGRAYAGAAAAVLPPAMGVCLLVQVAWGWAAAWAAAVVLSVVVQIPFTVLASRLVFDDRARVRDALRDAAREAPRVGAVRLLQLALAVVGLAFFVVPGFWAAASYAFTSEVLLLERATVGQALSRAPRLASSSVGEALLGLFALALVHAAAVALAEQGGRAILGELLQFRPPPSALREGGSVLALVGWFGAVPYLATARFLVYLNVRTRAEGWDVQTRFAALVARAARDEAASLEAREEAA